jgi:small-conductance mechanosensitive channel
MALNFESVFFGNSLISYLIAAGIFLASMIFFKLIKFVVLKRIQKIAKQTANKIDDFAVELLDSIGWPLYAIVALYLSLMLLNLPLLIFTIVKYAAIILGVWYLMRALMQLVDFVSSLVSKARQNRADEDTSMIGFLANFAKWLLWLFALLVFLHTIGVNITSIIAGLGIGGIAIAFALQNILSDIFASISIYFDKPFEIGDFIVIGNDSGVVERIGIKSTRIKTLKGQQLVVSNKELTSTRVDNYKRMEKRRVVFAIGLVYSTSAKQLARVPGIIKKLISKVEHAELSRVHFNGFGAYSLDFEIVYHVDTKDYGVYMDTHQEVLLQIKSEFEKQKLKFAYPTQSIFIEK